jgi:hypothetical protein
MGNERYWSRRAKPTIWSSDYTSSDTTAAKRLSSMTNIVPPSGFPQRRYIAGLFKSPTTPAHRKPARVICAYSSGKADAVIRACELGLVLRIVLGAALARAVAAKLARMVA